MQRIHRGIHHPFVADCSVVDQYGGKLYISMAKKRKWNRGFNIFRDPSDRAQNFVISDQNIQPSSACELMN